MINYMKKQKKNMKDLKTDWCPPPSVFLEYSLVTINWIDDLQTVFANLLKLVRYSGDEEVVLRAAHYMDEYELTPFDAFHCAEVHEEKIIRSDQKFDRTLVDRIEL